jgi:thioredoxin reductase (NADPH)
MERAELLVVGSGPAGIATSVEAKVAEIRNVIILEKTDHICDTAVRFYPKGKRVDPFFTKIREEPLGTLSFDVESREEFLARMNKVVTDYALDIRFRHDVRRIMKKNDYFEVHAANNNLFEALVCIIAIGVFGSPVKPSYKIPKEVQDKVFFGMSLETPKTKKALVVGGGNTAVETACFLCGGNEVCLSYRRPQFFRPNPMNVCTLEGKCKEGLIELLLNTDIESLEPEGDQVKVNFKDGRRMSFDTIYYCLGGSTPQSFLRSVGVELKDKRAIASQDGETNIKGLFVVGDLVAEKGTIMGAFNSAKLAVEGILQKYGDKVK